MWHASGSAACTTRSTRGHEVRAIPLCLAALIQLAAVAVPAAKLAVFVDGRVLRVIDARLAGHRIALELPGGGTLEVPATSLDRVITDDTEAAADSPPLATAACSPGWSKAPLPPDIPFHSEIEAAARAANLHPWLLAAVVQVESAFDPRAESRAGARGLTQLMPAAAADHKVRNVWKPADNLRGGAEHLRALLDRFHSLPLALAAYNSGAATVERVGDVPPYVETRTFVARVLAIFCPGTEAAPGGTLHRRGGQEP